MATFHPHDTLSTDALSLLLRLSLWVDSVLACLATDVILDDLFFCFFDLP